MLSSEIAGKLQEYETPFYLYDMGLLKATLSELRTDAARYGYKLHYAIKANFDSKILHEIKNAGIGIDCASGNELRCALEAGFAPETIVYAGVGKRDRELRYAIGERIFSINCESLQEICVIDEMSAALGVYPKIALRINPDIDPKTNHCIDTGQADSKFGIAYVKVLEKAEQLLSFKNVKIRGVHFHIGSQIRDMQVFVNMCERVNEIVSELERRGFCIEFVNMGGGLGVNYDNPEREPIAGFKKFFATIHEHLDVGNREIHFEFGRAIVAQCGELITRVLFNKTTETGRKLVIVDASMTELIRPALYGAYHNIENITSADAMTEKYTVVGTACESTDVFDENIPLRKTSRGDLLTIKSAGAYGMSMASRYNLHDLPGAVYYDRP